MSSGPLTPPVRPLSSASSSSDAETSDAIRRIRALQLPAAPTPSPAAGAPISADEGPARVTSGVAPPGPAVLIAQPTPVPIPVPAASGSLLAGAGASRSSPSTPTPASALAEAVAEIAPVAHEGRSVAERIAVPLTSVELPGPTGWTVAPAREGGDPSSAHARTPSASAGSPPPSLDGTRVERGTGSAQTAVDAVPPSLPPLLAPVTVSVQTPPPSAPLPTTDLTRPRTTSFDVALQQLRAQLAAPRVADFLVEAVSTRAGHAPVSTRSTPAAVPTSELPGSSLSPVPCDTAAARPVPTSSGHALVVRRRRNQWEVATGGVPLFASSSSEKENGHDEGLFSDGSSYSTGRIGEAPELPHVGTRRTTGHDPVWGDELMEESPAEAAAHHARRQERRRTLAKQAAKRTVVKTLEATLTSASSGSQQGVSGTSLDPSPHKTAAARSAGAPPLRSSGGRTTREKATGDRPRQGRARVAERALDSSEESVSVRVDAAPAGVVPPTHSIEVTPPQDSAAPYIPSLRGPVSLLRSLYAASVERGGGPAGQQQQQQQSLFGWRPPTAPSAHEDPASPGEARPALGAVLSVTVRGMSPLHADVGVVHPLVRVWFLHCVTGENLVASGSAVPCAITYPYDLRSHGSRSPWWEAEVTFRLHRELVRRHGRRGVLLFEVLDCGSETIHGFFMPRPGLYPICWGYLMLHDCFGQPHTLFAENVHVQLYRYPMRTPWYVEWLQGALPTWLASAAIRAPTENFLDASGVLAGSETSATPAAVVTRMAPPSIFRIFKNPTFRSLPYKGGLVVNVRAPRDAAYRPRLTNMLPYEVYMLNLLIAGGGSCAAPLHDERATADDVSTSSDEDGGDDRTGGRRMGPSDTLVGRRGARIRALYRSMSIVNQRAMSMAYTRDLGERALLPTAPVQTAPVPGVVTCMTFCHDSPLLVLGVTRSLQYVVELRHPLQPNLPLLAEMHGHTGHIHAVAVQSDDRYVLACSSDKTVRVWRMTDLSQTILPAMDKLWSRGGGAQVDVQPVCVLPHAYPVYTAVFHQGTVVTGGYGPLLQVWRYEAGVERSRRGPRASLSPPTSAFATPIAAGLSREMESSMRLTATFTPGLRSSDGRPDTATSHATPVGERICAAEVEEGDLVLSLASNESSNRVWSVCSRGNVYCWRAMYEDRRRQGEPDESVFQLSVRHRRDCAGAARVEVRGQYAVVTCVGSSVVYVFDAPSGEAVCVVHTRVPDGAPVRLLPDGEALVAGLPDGTLAAWDCSDGALCTPPHGAYAKVQTKFPIADMAWSDGHHLVAMQSPAPCPAAYQPSLGVVMPLSGAGLSLTAPEPPALPMEVTLVAVAGMPRGTGPPILLSDQSAAEDFCVRCGGDVAPKQRAARQAARSRALRRQQAEFEARKTRLYGDRRGASLALTASVLPDPSAALRGSLTMTPGLTGTAADGFLGSSMGSGTGGLARTGAPPPLPPSMAYTEKGARINAIMGFWRGLVGQHRHTRATPTREVESGPTHRLHNDLPTERGSVAASVEVCVGSNEPVPLETSPQEREHAKVEEKESVDTLRGEDL